MLIAVYLSFTSCSFNNENFSFFSPFLALPDQGAPKITGGRPRYQIGDTVRINCTAGRSKPAVQLAWFINGEPAEPYQLRKYDPVLWGRDGLETSILGLQFRVDQHHFRNGDMKLKVSIFYILELWIKTYFLMDIIGIRSTGARNLHYCGFLYQY